MPTHYFNNTQNTHTNNLQYYTSNTNKKQQFLVVKICLENYKNNKQNNSFNNTVVNVNKKFNKNGFFNIYNFVLCLTFLTLTVAHLFIFQVNYCFIPCFAVYVNSFESLAKAMLNVACFLAGVTFITQTKKTLNKIFPKCEKFFLNSSEYVLCDYKNKTAEFYLLKYNHNVEEKINSIVENVVYKNFERYNKYSHILNML